MEEKKITKREMYTAIIDIITNGTTEIPVSAEDISTFCQKEIGALDRRAEKAREKAAKKREEGDALTALVKEVLTEEYAPIAEIAARIESDEMDVTVHRVQYRLNQLVESGEAEKADISVGEAGAKRTLKGYKLATN